MSVDSICTVYNRWNLGVRTFFWFGDPTLLNFPLMYCIPWRIHAAAIYGAPWIPSIYPLYVSIYTSTMDPMGIYIRRNFVLAQLVRIFRVQMCVWTTFLCWSGNWVKLKFHLVGGLEPWNFMTFHFNPFHIYGNVIIPTDDSSIIFQRAGAQALTRWTFHRDSPWLFDQIWLVSLHSHIGSMVLLYMVTWIPAIYPIYVSIPAPWIRHGI